MRAVNNRGDMILVVLATLLSAFTGLVSVLAVMVFTGHESNLMWVTIYLPAILWIAAALCYKFPRFGLLFYLVLLMASLILCVAPFNHPNVQIARWKACADGLRFALIGAALLIVNLAISKPSTQTP